MLSFGLIALFLTLVASQRTPQGGNTPWVEPRDVKNFNALIVDGPFSVQLSFGREESLILKASNEKFISNVDTFVENSTLYVRPINYNILFTGIFQIELIAKSINVIVASGPAQISATQIVQASTFRMAASNAASISGTFRAENMNAVVTDAASLILTLDVGNLNAQLSGAGTFNGKGQADNLNLVVTGSSVYHGRLLRGLTVSAYVNGAGRAYINAQDNLKAVVSQNAVVRYSGSAKLEPDVSQGAIFEKDI